MLDSNFVYVLSTRVVTSAFLLVLGLVGCGGEGPDNPDKTDAPGAAEAVGSDAQAIQQAPTFERIEHYVPVGPNRTIHLTETRRAGGCHHNSGEHRAVVMLPGPATRGNFFNIDVAGYDGGRLLAARGFNAFAVDFEGSGLSSYPAHGLDVTLDNQAQAVKAVINYIHNERDIPKVDVLGESWGGGVAAEVCAYRSRVRSCILGSVIYKTASPVAAAQFQSPGWGAFLDAQPDGYLQTPPPLYLGLVASSPADVQTWTLANEPWNYSIRPFKDFFTLPYFDPGQARVPALIIRGENDPNTLASDAQQLADDYGRPGVKVKLVTIPGGGHIPRIESAPNNNLYWDAVTDFLD